MSPVIVLCTYSARILGSCGALVMDIRPVYPVRSRLNIRDGDRGDYSNGQFCRNKYRGKL